MLNDIAYNLILKKGTAANLALATTFLQQGELAYTTDAQGLNIGAGSNVKLTIPVVESRPNKLTSQYAALSAVSLIASVPVAGMYRVSYVATIVQASDVSSALGGTTGFQLTFTNGNGDTVSKTSNPTTPVISAANTTATTVSGDLYCYAKAASAITYSFGYTDSHVSHNMQYDIAVYVEYLGA